MRDYPQLVSVGRPEVYQLPYHTLMITIDMHVPRTRYATTNWLLPGACWQHARSQNDGNVGWISFKVMTSHTFRDNVVINTRSQGCFGSINHATHNPSRKRFHVAHPRLVCFSADKNTRCRRISQPNNTHRVIQSYIIKISA